MAEGLEATDKRGRYRRFDGVEELVGEDDFHTDSSIADCGRLLTVSDTGFVVKTGNIGRDKLEVDVVGLRGGHLR